MVPPRSMPKKPAKKAPKRGRPPKPPEERRTATLGVRLHPDERMELAAAADAEGVTVTQLILAAVRFYRSRKK